MPEIRYWYRRSAANVVGNPVEAVIVNQWKKQLETNPGQPVTNAA